jgi:hypothetical protein
VSSATPVPSACAPPLTYAATAAAACFVHVVLQRGRSPSPVHVLFSGPRSWHPLSGKGKSDAAQTWLQGREAGLEELDISNNGLTAAAATPIATLLSGSTLKNLNLNMNDFADAGMYAIAAAIQEGQGLEKLDVGGCNIGPEGAAVLMGALKDHKSLRTLELGCALDV